MSATQYADPDTKLDVDIMILDYFLYSTIKSIINERAAEREGQECLPDCESWLEMTEGVSHLFKFNHPEGEVPDDLQIRWNLFNFTNLFFRRHRQSAYLPSPEALQAQRNENAERAQKWLQQNDFLQAPSDALADGCNFKLQLSDNYRDMLSHMRMPCSDQPNLKSSVTLLDILPNYMALCDLMPSELRERWAKAGIAFMMHSALERILIFGKSELETIHEAFAWTLKTGNYEDLWAEERDYTKGLILPEHGREWDDQLQKTILENPLFTFEGEILELSEAVLQTIPSPLLSRLETGDITLPSWASQI